MSLPCWAGRMGCGDTCWAETSPWSRAQFLSNLPTLLLCLTAGMQAPGPEQRIPRTEPGTRERLLLGTRDAATLFWPGTCFLRELFSIFHSLLWSPLSCLTQMTAECVWPLLFFCRGTAWCPAVAHGRGAASSSPACPLAARVCEWHLGAG